MPTDTESDLHLEIGHVLFIDIVGYSKLLIDEQREQIQKLREIDDVLILRSDKPRASSQES